MKEIAHLKGLNIYLILIYFFMITTPFYFFPSQYPLFTIFFIVMFVFYYKKEVFTQLKVVFENKALVLLSLYFLYTYIALLWTSNIEHGFAVQKVYREALFYIPILYIFLNQKNAEISLKLFCIGFGIYALYSIGFYLEFYQYDVSTKDNPQGHLGYETVTVMMSLGVFFSSIFYYFESNNKMKYLFILIFILCFIGLGINNGRAAQLSFLLVLITLLIIYRKNIFSRNIILIFLGLIIILGVIFYSNKSRFERGYLELEKVLTEKKYEGSWGTRAYMYVTGLKIIEKNLFFGVGTGDSKDSYRFIASKENSPYAWYSHMHNQHIELLSRYGIIGYLFLFISVVYLLYSIRKNNKFFILGLVFYLTIFYNSFFNTLLDRKPIYVLFFVIFSLLAILNKKEKINQ
ncbi:O-antigen ligase family protein [Aliarcobacter butzleri]|uniref:O-antigen ligase family protein n=1 Tax=Aliarcobacter butzleri TaxID=28197 RepID=UPI00215B5DBA|nr:O-antigen ligase family protein [Aliarcobacter butzleri]MCR8711241.1 O-antigen ligase family protein [Aliarcobacter butzleri]